MKIKEGNQYMDRGKRSGEDHSTSMRHRKSSQRGRKWIEIVSECLEAVLFTAACTAGAGAGAGPSFFSPTGGPFHLFHLHLHLPRFTVLCIRTYLPFGFWRGP